MAHRKILSIGILGTALMLAGCSWFKKPKVNNNGGRGQKQTQSVKGTLGDDGEPGLSNRSNIRFKKVYLLRNDFARALQLPPNQLCIEAGKDCLGSYNIVLGGVDPNMMLYERIEQPVTTSPIAVERIAMQACSRRVNLDFGGSKSLIFADIPKSGSTFEQSHRDAVQRLYQNFLQRDPTDGDYAGHEKLLDSLGSMVSGQEIGKVWAQTACWMVATQLESVLY